MGAAGEGAAGMDREELERRLAALPRESVVLFAARSALRAAPEIGRLFELAPRTWASALPPLFRGMAAPWVASQWPTDGAALTAAAQAASTSASTVASASTAADASACAAFAAAADDAAVACAASANAAADGAAASEADVAVLETTGAAHPLARLPLWSDGAPASLLEAWDQLKMQLPTGEHWGVWTRWYEARVRGAAANPVLEVARVEELTEEEWAAGPAVANARLKEIEDRFK